MFVKVVAKRGKVSINAVKNISQQQDSAWLKLMKLIVLMQNGEKGVQTQ